MAEVSAFIRDVCFQQQVQAEKQMETARRAAQAEKCEMRAEMQKMRDGLTPQERISAEQLAVLQARLEALHGARLLTDDELFGLEDLCADIIELKSSVGKLTAEIAQSNPDAAKACRLVALSENMVSDAAFARQLRRKFA